MSPGGEEEQGEEGGSRYECVVQAVASRCRSRCREAAEARTEKSKQIPEM